MSQQSAIEWTDATWNPTTGCTKVSPACANCYIERTIPFRTKGRKFVNGHIPLELHPNRLDWPSKWKEPRMVFVNSLSDLFHQDVPFEYVKRVLDVMAREQRHTFQVLTKRPERLLEFTQWMAGADDISIAGWPRNVWLGVSAENQRMADLRIPILLRVPAARYFISAEPLLGAINLRRVWDERGRPADISLDWVIVGGESGPRVRPTDPQWVRDIRDQCVEAGVPFFFKQWGGTTAKSGGRTLDGRTWDEMPS